MGLAVRPLFPFFIPFRPLGVWIRIFVASLPTREKDSGLNGFCSAQGMTGKVTFSNPRGADYVFGECRPLRFEGQKLLVAGRDTPLAEHVGHAWVTSEGEFLRIDCELFGHGAF
jgi:hypothetical protein